MSSGNSNQRTFDLAAVETRLRLETEGRTWVVDREHPAFCFGREADNDLVVGDRLVSRHHGRIDYRDGRFHLTDDSRNGTLVTFTGGATHLARREALLLHGGGTVRLGHPRGAGFAFVAEIRGGDRQRWQACSDQPANVFQRDGDVWTLQYDGRVVRLKDARGLRYLAALLRHPARDFHVLDLALVDPEGHPPGDAPDRSRTPTRARPTVAGWPSSVKSWRRPSASTTSGVPGKRATRSRPSRGRSRRPSAWAAAIGRPPRTPSAAGWR